MNTTLNNKTQIKNGTEIDGAVFWCPDIKVTYVDGVEIDISANEWKKIRSDGVDYIVIDNIHISSASAYWIYPESNDWVVGWGSFGYDPNPLTEIVLTCDSQTERKIDFAPDLLHNQIKLGWWWPGKERPNG